MQYQKLTLEEINKRKEERRQDKYNKTHKMINNIDHKLCNKHHIYFPEEDPWLPSTNEFFYHNNKNSIDFLNPECKKCSVSKATIWIKENPELFKQSYKRYMKTDSWKAYKIENNKKTKDIMSKWRKDNPDLCKIYAEQHRSHDITDKEWKLCQEVFQFKCAYCDKTLEQQYQQNNEQFHKEHVEHEGYNDIRNCVPACTQCNSKKRQKTINELYENNEIKAFTKDKYDFIMWWCTDGFQKYIEYKPPYKIIKKKNNDKNTFHWELWTVDEQRNIIELIAMRNKRKDITKDLENGSIVL